MYYSYNIGNMAQKFLPSHRKWLDYEAVFNKGGMSSSVIYTMPQVNAPVDNRSIFCFKKERFIGGRHNEKVFSV